MKKNSLKDIVDGMDKLSHEINEEKRVKILNEKRRIKLNNEHEKLKEEAAKVELKKENKAKVKASARTVIILFIATVLVLISITPAQWHEILSTLVILVPFLGIALARR